MKYSIIIPAYNSSGYIRRALGSVKSQTCTDYELIVVCDSCTDNTEEIAKEYGAKTLTVNYNRDGLTRNAGIDVAQGDWLLFMDDDDWWLHENVLSQLEPELPGADIVRFSFMWRGKGYSRCGDYFAVWNKAWRRSFIGKTRFSDVQSWSDVDFHKAMMEKHPRIKDLDVLMYYYNYMREGSQSWQNI